jgi:hypothetical protein
MAFAVTDLDGVPADISGADIRMAVCEVESHTIVLSTEGGSPGGSISATITDAEHGLFEAAVTGNNTANLLGTYEWQAKIDDALTSTATVGQGYTTFIRTLLPAV